MRSADANEVINLHVVKRREIAGDDRERRAGAPEPRVQGRLNERPTDAVARGLKARGVDRDDVHRVFAMVHLASAHAKGSLNLGNAFTHTSAEVVFQKKILPGPSDHT